MKSQKKVLGAVLICCALVLAFTACAGCTGNSSGSTTSTPDDPIVGTYGLDAEQLLKTYDTVVPTEYEKKLMTMTGITPEVWLKNYTIKITFNNDGTGKYVTAYSGSSVPESDEQLTWKKIGDRTYSFVIGESTETVTFDPIKGTLTSSDLPFKKLA